MLPVLLIFGLFGAAAPALANATSSQNVNSRYIVEAVELSKSAFTRLSNELRKELDRLIGQNFDQELTGKLARRIRRELQAARVTHRLVRGGQPEHVKVIFDEQGRHLEQEPSITKLSYHSKQGWTGGVEASADVAGNTITLGVQTDGDELLERYAGFNARYARAIGDRVRLRFDYQTFHQLWNGSTLAAMAPSGFRELYRSRDSYSPSVAVLLAPGLTLTSGLSFNNIEFQYPAAQTRSANAVTTTLRYRGRRDGNTSRQEVEAGYSLRAATRIFESDQVYSRHALDARYVYGAGPQSVIVRFEGGSIAGDAPLYERFAIGATRTLRGWNKFDLAPLGGNRMAYGSLEYRYRVLALFYDTGSVWEEGRDATARHAVGAGFHWESVAFSIAFPVRGERVTPMFLLSANF